jgi:hypothetical protein
MKRVLFSFPTAIITFFVGVSAFLFLTRIDPWFDPLPSIEPPVREQIEIGYMIDLPLKSLTDIDESKRVYTAILSHENYRAKRIILDEFTERGGLIMDAAVADRSIDGADESTIESYEISNRSVSSLREILGYRTDIIFFTKKDDEALARDKNTPFEDKFAKRFPGSHRVISLSNVGFNSNRNEALVYVSYYCGGLCAGGSFFVLKKRSNKWVIAWQHQLWVS